MMLLFFEIKMAERTCKHYVPTNHSQRFIYKHYNYSRLSSACKKRKWK